MPNPSEPGGAGDPYDLQRFVEAQEGTYEKALSEVRSGRKRSHCMWYIFPQFNGLGSSPTSRWYSIKSVAEAEAYLRHPVLGPRLIACAEAALQVKGQSACEVFGSPDDMKLRSCATLFACVSPAGSVFDRLHKRYFQGERDPVTLRLLGAAPEGRQSFGGARAPCGSGSPGLGPTGAAVRVTGYRGDGPVDADSVENHSLRGRPVKP